MISISHWGQFSLPDGMPPSSINDLSRAVMAGMIEFAPLSYSLKVNLTRKLIDFRQQSWDDFKSRGAFG